MTEFGKWLGIANGQEMLFDILKENINKEQARAAVTTYCIMFGVQVDTFAWDDLINKIYDHYNSWFDDKDEMDMYMCELIV